MNTIICVFDLKRPRITAYVIHEWIYAQLRLKDNEVLMVQIDGPQKDICTYNCETITDYNKCSI